MNKQQLIDMSQRVRSIMHSYDPTINGDVNCVVTDALVDFVAKKIEAMAEDAYESWEEEASHYLCDGGGMLSIKEQVEMISSQAVEDGSVLIDDIDGVVVWEPLEGRFTADAFIEMIGY